MAATTLYFEVLRKHMHCYLDAKPNQTVLDLKKMLSPIVTANLDDMKLWKVDRNGFETVMLDDSLTLWRAGFNASNSPCFAPARIALQVLTEDDGVVVDAVSKPVDPATLRN